MARVVFIPIKSNGEKILKILELAHKAVLESRYLLIKVKDQKAGDYLDELLWKQNPSSFLPHVFSQNPTQEPICITQSDLNLNAASSLLNLSSSAILSPSEEIHLIYEFDDHSTPERSQVSKNLYSEYRKAHFPISLE